MATGAKKENQVSSARDGSPYYNIPASAPGSHNSPKCLLTEASVASLPSRTSLELASSNSSTLEAANLECVAVGQHQVDVKKSSPSKLPVLKSKSAPVPAKRTTLSKVLKKRANKEKTSGLRASVCSEGNIIHTYQNCPQESRETVSSTNFTGQEDAGSSKLAKKKSSSGSGIFGSWLRKKGKDSRCIAKPTPPQPIITIDHVDCDCDPSNQNTEQAIILDSDVDIRENRKSNGKSFDFSPRAVSGVSWKFDEGSESSATKSLIPKIGPPDHCSRLSGTSAEKDDLLQHASDSSFESFGPSPIDIYSTKIDMDLTNESMRSTCDNLSGASVGTLEAVQADASSTEKEMCAGPSSVEYCDLDWSECNYKDLQPDSRVFDGKDEGRADLAEDKHDSLYSTDALFSKGTHFGVMSVHNVNYPYVEGNVNKLGDSQVDTQVPNDAVGPHYWQHLLNPPRSSIFSIPVSRNSINRLTAIAEGECENQNSIPYVTSLSNSIAGSIDMNKSDIRGDKDVPKSIESTSSIPSVDMKTTSHCLPSSTADLMANSVITQDNTKSPIENFIKNETSPTHAYDSGVGSRLIKSKVVSDVPFTTNVDSSTPQNYLNAETSHSSNFENDSITTGSSLSNANNYVQMKDVANDVKSIDKGTPVFTFQEKCEIVSSKTLESNLLLNDVSLSLSSRVSHSAVESTSSSTDRREARESSTSFPENLPPKSIHSASQDLLPPEDNLEKNAGEISSGNDIRAASELEPETILDPATDGIKSNSDGDTTDTDEEEREPTPGHQTPKDLPQEARDSVFSSGTTNNTNYIAKATYVKPKIMNSTHPSSFGVPPSVLVSAKPSGFSNDLYLVCSGENSAFETSQNVAAAPKIPVTFTYNDLSNKFRDLVVNECYPSMPNPEDLDTVTFDPGNFDASLLQRLFALDFDDGTSEDDRETIRGIRTNLVDFQKKSEWLIKKRRMKTLRNLGGSSSEVVILHASDGTAWARYLSDFLLNALAYRPCTFPSPSGATDNVGATGSCDTASVASNPLYASSKSVGLRSPGSLQVNVQTPAGPNFVTPVCCCSKKLHQKSHHLPSVECRNVEQILGPSVPPILAQRLHTARVQVVVITPGFLSHVNDPQLDLGRVVVPRRVIGLLLGTSCTHVNDRHLGALFSFQEWPLLRVDSPSVWLCSAVLSRALAVLCSSRAYKGYCTEPPRGAFRICPSKVTEHQRHVYLMVEDQEDQDSEMVSLDGVERDDVCIELRYDNTVTRVQNWKYHNPYCVSFKMTDEVMRHSRLVEVRLAVEGAPLGSGKIKCENKMDTIAAILNSVSNAADVMCQSLGLPSVPGSLDQYLAACVRRHLPPFTSDRLFDGCTVPTSRRTTPQSTTVAWSRDPSNSKFPTWLHFAAHHGFIELTAALLSMPGWRGAVRQPDCDGNTPDRIAQAMGHDNLAERLEYLALMATDESLAAFEAPPNLSDMTTNSRLLLPSPDVTPQTENILRTSSTGSNRSADSFRSISSPSRSTNACSLSALRAVSGPPKLTSFSRLSTTDVLSSTPSSQPSVVSKTSSKSHISSQDKDSKPGVGSLSRIKGVRSYQTLNVTPSVSKPDQADDHLRNSCKMFETTVKCEESATSNCENNPEASDSDNNFGCTSTGDISENYVTASNGVLNRKVENVLSNYDTVAVPRPVPLASLPKASIQSGMLGSAYEKPVPIRRQRSDESSSSHIAKANVGPDCRSKSTECILKDGSDSRAQGNFCAYNHQLSKTVFLEGRPSPMHKSGHPSWSENGKFVKSNNVVEVLSTFRCPEDSLPPIPSLNPSENSLQFTNASSSDRGATDQSLKKVENNGPSNSTLNSTNGSALHDNQVSWVQRSQTSDSPDSSYLDMTPSDTSAFNSSLSVMQASGHDSLSMLTHEQLLSRLNQVTINSRFHHQSESELHESYMESSSFVLPSEILEYASLTRSVTLPTYSTSHMRNTDLSTNSTSAVDITSSSSSPLPNDTEARLNPSVPTGSSCTNISIGNDGSPLSISSTHSSLSSSIVPSLPLPQSSSAAVEGYMRTHERLRFPVNGAESSSRNQISGSNESQTNFARSAPLGNRLTHVNSQVSSPAVPVSSDANLSNATGHQSGAEAAAAAAVQETRVVQNASFQQGVAARLKDFFKGRSKHRLGGGHAGSGGYLTPQPGDPHNDYVDDPTAALQRSSSADALSNGTSHEASTVSSVSDVDSQGGRFLQPQTLSSTSAQPSSLSSTSFSTRACPTNPHSNSEDSEGLSSFTQLPGLHNGHNRVLVPLPVSSSHNPYATCPKPTKPSHTNKGTREHALSSPNSHFNCVYDPASRRRAPTDTQGNISVDLSNTRSSERVQINFDGARAPQQSSHQSDLPPAHEVLNSAPISTYVNTGPQGIASLEST